MKIMSLIPLRKAFDASTRSSAYIFLCSLRKFPVIMQYKSLKLFSEINGIDSVQSLLRMKDFDNLECGVYEENVIGQLFHRGYTVSKVSRLTDIQPLEIAMYYSGVVSADEETLRIILESTGHIDILPEPLNYVYGEAVSEL